MAADANTSAQSINTERTSLRFSLYKCSTVDRHALRAIHRFHIVRMQISRAMLVLQSAPIAVILAMFYKQESSYFRSNETTTNARKA